MGYLHTLHELDIDAEVYLEPFQAYMLERFGENS